MKSVPFDVSADEIRAFEQAAGISPKVAFCFHRKGYVQQSQEEDHREEVWFADQMLKVWIAARNYTVPHGYVVIPPTPTYKMREAMYMAQHFHMSTINPDEWDAVDKSYAALIQAAQK